jgi:hypothetical protein
MASHHISLRVDEATFERLERHSKRAGQSRSHVVSTFLEEGLRMEEHPGIVFRGGPHGRRAGLAAGPDVWEVARVLSATESADSAGLERAAYLTGLTPAQVRTAWRYYAQYPDEIDEWIRSVDDEAQHAEGVWLRQRGHSSG